MRKEFDFYVYLLKIYAILNPEFISSLEHKQCCCDVMDGYWVDLHSEVALDWRNFLLETSAISEIIENPLERLFFAYSK